DELEGGPVARMGGFRAADPFELRLAQRLVLGQAVSQMPVELRHEAGGGAVADLPEGGEDGARAGELEGARQSEQPFAPHLLAEGRVAGRERDEVGVEPQL